MTIEESYNFRRIHERLTTSGLVSAEQLGDLRRQDYDAVINLLPETHERAVADEAAIVRGQGLDYVYIPVDFEAPTHEDLEAFAHAMTGRSGQKVHVHCAANYRVSAFYSLYALRNGVCTPDEADQLVRDVWNPAEFPVWSAFITDERTRTTRPGDTTIEEGGARPGPLRSAD
jgi:protein tyrosine phosphatase (PTP) superfamily phosphohydrolase (DUF442 family)